MIDIKDLLDNIDPQDWQDIKEGVIDLFDGLSDGFSDFIDDFEQNYQKVIQKPCYFEEQQSGDAYCGLIGINDLSSGSNSHVDVVYPKKCDRKKCPIHLPYALLKSIKP